MRNNFDDKFVKRDDYKKKEEIVQPSQGKRLSPYERTRAQVYATGNKWAIENFNATHN